MPGPANLNITQSSMFTVLACRIFIALRPLQKPLMETPRIVITSVAAALMVMPVTREARIEANVPEPSIVIDLVIVTAPKPPGSIASISPQAAVLEIAPAKVLQGAVRLQGLASSPTPETQVRVACAAAGDADNVQVNRHVSNAGSQRILIFSPFLISHDPWIGRPPADPTPKSPVKSFPLLLFRSSYTRLGEGSNGRLFSFFGSIVRKWEPPLAK